MLTVPAGADVASFQDRQVAALAPEDWANWLYLERSESQLLRPLPRGSLKVTLAKSGVNSQPPELLERTGNFRAGDLAADP